MLIRLNLRTSCWQTQKKRRAGKASIAASQKRGVRLWTRLGARFVACQWDDVAFRRTTKEKKFCSAECRESWAATRNTDVTYLREGRPGVEDSRERIGAQSRKPRHRSLSNTEQRRGKSKAIDRLTPRKLELAMRSDDYYRPPRRLRWLSTNLAVSEMY